MKKLQMTLAALLAAAGTVFAAENPNLLTNGNFEGKGHSWTDFTRGTWKNSIITEPETSNKCYRMELQKFLTNAKGTKRVGGFLAIGRTGNYFGVKVKPDTEYEISFSLKSNFVPHAFSVSVTTWDTLTTSQWVKGRKQIRCPKRFTYNDKDWTTCRATFRTGANAQTAAVVFQVWGDESQQRNFNIELGQFYMVDNVELREVASAK